MWNPHAPNSRTENQGKTAATSRGTTITAGGSADTKGTWVNLGAATSFAYETIMVCMTRPNASDIVIDIGISDGSNRWVLAADLRFAALRVVSEPTCQIVVPVHVPSGAQLSARCASSVGGAACDVLVIGSSSGLGGAPGFSRCVALFTFSTARGVAIDPGAAANTKGAWAQITASCPNDIGAMFGLIGHNGDVARAAAAAMLLDIGIGAAASEFVLYPNASLKWSTVTDGPTNCPRIPVFACNVPATTRIAARAQCSITTAGDRTVDLALYGLVP